MNSIYQEDGMKILAIDFEYRGTNNPTLDLVACATSSYNTKTKEEYTRVYWLADDPEEQEKLKQFLLRKRKDYTLLVFNNDAEGRSLISLGLNPIKFKTIDIQAEWKMLTNHNDEFGYGRQFIDGRFKTTTRKTYGEDDGGFHDRTPVNLLACTSKLLNNVTSKDYFLKNEMRDLILKNETYTDDQKKRIMEYCKGDIKDLYKLFSKIYNYHKGFYKHLPGGSNVLISEMLYRGETVARAAVIAAIGYPVNREKVTNFTKNIPQILIDIQEDINNQFPDMEVFRWDKKLERYSLNTKAPKAWIDESPYRENWLETAKGDYSLALEAWEKHFSWRHDFPRDNFPAQFLRYLKTKKSLNGFMPKSIKAKNRDTFFSYYGDDDRAHPYLNAYGAQSARYQPKATGFMHLKAAWMRSLVEPKPGRAIASIDYKSQEFLISAIMSNDSNMLAAYDSGDVYLYFARVAGAFPKNKEYDSNNEEHKMIRDRFKATTLGISYGMGANALAAKLTSDTGIEHDYDDAMELIDAFYDTYPDYKDWSDDLKFDYQCEGKIKLVDGWTMFGDNDNIRSVGNMPVQGMGSCILRKAIKLCQDAGLTVILPLHDALYIEYDSDDFEQVSDFAWQMKAAFRGCLMDAKRQGLIASDTGNDYIKLDCDIWSPDYEPMKGTKKLITEDLEANVYGVYVDKRSKAEYERFSKYMEEVNGEV